MAGAQHSPVTAPAAHGRAFWLSPNGWDNGLDDDAWVAVLDLANGYVATVLLFELRLAGVPAYAAHVGAARPHEAVVRVWVGASRYGAAQVSLIRQVPNLVSRFGPGIIR